MNTTADPLEECLAWYKYVRQDKTWVPKDRPPLPIAEMDATWRHNAARWLLRRAAVVAMRYGFGEIQFIYGTTAPTVVADENGQPVPGPEMPIFAPRGEWAQDSLERELEEAQRQRDADPEGWLKTTPLYQALVQDLPERAS